MLKMTREELKETRKGRIEKFHEVQRQIKEKALYDMKIDRFYRHREAPNLRPRVGEDWDCFLRRVKHQYNEDWIYHPSYPKHAAGFYGVAGYRGEFYHSETAYALAARLWREHPARRTPRPGEFVIIKNGQPTDNFTQLVAKDPAPSEEDPHVAQKIVDGASDAFCMCIMAIAILTSLYFLAA